MTNSKMIRILKSYETVDLVRLIDVDKFDFEKDCFTFPVREYLTLDDFIKEFEEQSGTYFNKYHIGQAFKELIKAIEAHKIIGKEYREYSDSREERELFWDEYHPGVSFEQWKVEKAKRDAKERAEFNRQWGHYIDMFRPYYEISKRIFA